MQFAALNHLSVTCFVIYTAFCPNIL